MTQLEMVEKIREKANVTYEEAKAALERNNWDMLDAMVDLERQGKIRNDVPPYSYTSTENTAQDGSYRKVDATASEGRTEKKHSGRFFMDEVKKLLKKGMENSFQVMKDGKMLFCIPFLIFLVLLICSFWVVLPLLVIGMFFGCRYSFHGQELENENLNGTMDKAADYVDDLVNKYKESRKDGE